MSILTLEIGDEPVACIHAAEGMSHQEILHQPWLHRDLVSHIRDGSPLWDGSAPVSLRPPTQAESDHVDESFKAHHLAHDPNAEEKEFIVFLVPVERAERDDSEDDFPI